MERFANEVAAGRILAKMDVDERRNPERAVAKAQAHAILALAEQLSRVADALEETNRRR